MKFKFSVFLVVLFTTICLAQRAQCQAKDMFSYSIVHKVDERDSYSIFYPQEPDAYAGVIVFIHSAQASNPKVYGNLFEHFLRQNYIIIYPAYQDYVVSNNKDDLDFISSSLESAYADIKRNYSSILNLPVALVGHSMGGMIVMELATGKVSLPKMPSCIISICPAEVPHHKLNNLDFEKLDWYDVYLVIEEKSDRHYRKQTGRNLYSNLEEALRKRYVVHEKDSLGGSGHMNLWALDKEFSSRNNTFATYFPRLFARTNKVDTDLYWLEIEKALGCAFSRKNCEDFRE